MNRRGKSSVWAVIIWAVVLFIILGVVLVSYFDTNFSGKIAGLPSVAGTVYDVVISVFEPIVNGIWFVVAPTGPGTNDNVRMIALAIFFLITFIGTKLLRPLIKGHFLAFAISIIIGVITARSLTGAILERSGFVASPIVALSLFLGFGVIYYVTKNINNWPFGETPPGKLTIYTVIAAVFLVVYWQVFDSLILGIIFAAGTVAMGVMEMVYPAYKEHKEKREGVQTGETMAEIKDVEETGKELAEGCEEGERK
jgi:hypothetical protein